jgi:hypothetical protein
MKNNIDIKAVMKNLKIQHKVFKKTSVYVNDYWSGIATGLRMAIEMLDCKTIKDKEYQEKLRLTLEK